MDYHVFTKKCDGMCDSCECPPADTDPTLKPDIAALKKRLAEDPGFAAQVTGDRPLRRGVDGVCTRSTCECEREGLGDQCVWLKPAEVEFECLGEPSLCDNPRGCACLQAGRTDRPSTPVGWSDTDWLKRLEEIRQDQAVYHRGPLPETGGD